MTPDQEKRLRATAASKWHVELFDSEDVRALLKAWDEEREWRKEISAAIKQLPEFESGG